MIKNCVPKVHFYDQDFVDLYERIWIWIDEIWKVGNPLFPEGFCCFSEVGESTKNKESEVKTEKKTKKAKEGVKLDLFDVEIASLFLCHSNSIYSPFSMLDFFYSKQDKESFRIPPKYDTGKKSAIIGDEKGLALPLLPYVEFVVFHQIGNKKRLREVAPVLKKYSKWIEKNYLNEKVGLFSVPEAVLRTPNLDRKKAKYTIDFNAIMALYYLYMSFIGDILNDKDLSFAFKRKYYILKGKINEKMWSIDDSFYYDLDEKEAHTGVKHLGSFWTLIAEIADDEKAALMIEELKDPLLFGSDNPFPTLPVSSPDFKEDGELWSGGVSSFMNYFVIKGLEKYGEFTYARECAIRHMYYILDTLNAGENVQGDTWEYYKANSEGPSLVTKGKTENRRRYIPSLGLIAISLCIENIIGLDISLPRKTISWTMPELEVIGIEGLLLKKNLISVLANKNQRGWEIRFESEKLYYFTLNVLEENMEKTLPIPSGKCSLFVDTM